MVNCSAQSPPNNIVAVLGCGLMGSGITQVCISSGFTVNLYGRNETKLLEAQKQIKWGLTKILTKMKGNPVTDEEKYVIFQGVNSQISQLRLCTDIENTVHDADIIIEAVVENLDVKKKIFLNAQNYCSKNALLITNTSSICLVNFLESIRDPSLFAGLHFFNPVPVLKLVEVVSSPETSQETKDKLIEFCKSLGKLPVSCKDTPGFIVNRLLVPYLIDSIRMLERGDASKEDIDAAMRCGTSYPMGPLELCDYVGLDTIANVMDVWRVSMPYDSRFAPCVLLDKLVSEGKLGRKTKQGFYTY